MSDIGVLIRESTTFIERHQLSGNEVTNLTIANRIINGRDGLIFRERNPSEWATFLAATIVPRKTALQDQWAMLIPTASAQERFLARQLGLE